MKIKIWQFVSLLFSGSGGEICNQSISVSDYNIGDGGNQNMYFFDWGTNIRVMK